jgi:hypothetical protein
MTGGVTGSTGTAGSTGVAGVPAPQVYWRCGVRVRVCGATGSTGTAGERWKRGKCRERWALKA